VFEAKVLYFVKPVCLVRMSESADAGRILVTVSQSDCNRPAGRRHTSWLAIMKNIPQLGNPFPEGFFILEFFFITRNSGMENSRNPWHPGSRSLGMDSLTTTLVWKMPPSWHWTGHSAG